MGKYTFDNRHTLSCNVSWSNHVKPKNNSKDIEIITAIYVCTTSFVEICKLCTHHIYYISCGNKIITVSNVYMCI